MKSKIYIADMDSGSFNLNDSKGFVIKEDGLQRLNILSDGGDVFFNLPQDDNVYFVKDDGTTVDLFDISVDYSNLSDNYIPIYDSTTEGLINSPLYEFSSTLMYSTSSLLINDGQNYVELGVTREVEETASNFKQWINRILVGNPDGSFTLQNSNTTDGITNNLTFGGSDELSQLNFDGTIYTIYHSGNLDLSDYITLTSTSTTDPSSSTYNISMGEVSSSGEIHIQSLAGNVLALNPAGNSVEFSGGYGSTGTTFNNGNLTTNGSITSDGNFILFNSTYTTNIQMGAVSANTTVTLPEESGQLALTADYVPIIGGAYTGGVTFGGNIAFSDGTYATTITEGTLSANNTITLPTEAGTLALTSDIKDETFDSDLSPTLAMENAVGSIPAGTTIGDLQGLTFTQYIEQQNFPTVIAYISDSANLSVSGFNTSAVEVGVAYSTTLSVTYDTGIINNGDGTVAGSVTGDLATLLLTDPDSNTDYSNNSVSGNADSSVILDPYSLELGTNTWTVSGTNAVGTTTYTDNKGGTETVTSIEAAKADTTPSNITLSKTAYYPLFYGMTSSEYSDGDGDFYSYVLTKEIAQTGSRNILLNGTNEYIYFAYPSSFGTLSSIVDGNGFDVTSSFTLIVDDVTSTGLDTNYTREYNIYRTLAVTSVGGQTFQFNF